MHLRAPSFTLVAMLALTHSACGLTDDHTFTAAELETAPSQITVDGQRLTLKAYVSRDFQPIAPPEGKPLMAIVVIEAAPAGLVVERGWVIKGDISWSAAPSDIRRHDDDGGYLEVVFRNGPLWQPGIAVDIVVLLRDRDAKHLLSVRQQEIERTI